MNRKKKEIRMLEEAIVQNEERRNRLQREWLDFKEDDLKTAAKALAECEYKLEISVRQLGEQQIVRKKKEKIWIRFGLRSGSFVQKHI